MNYNIATLPDGLRVIHLPSDLPVVYCGYQVNAGTRDELPAEEGLAHFCEHMTFKGTEKRSAWNILNCLESVGGAVNAYTNKEDTVFYAAVPRQYAKRAVDLLTDIVFHSTYPQQEIDKEVEVICDEIESYNDSPADLIYDDFENILFNGHPLGHNILGTAERVRSFTTADAKRFTTKYYRPDNTIFFMYGGSKMPTINTVPVLPDTSVNVRAAFAAPQGNGSVIVRNKDTHQAHVMVGNTAYGYNDKRRMALYLLNNILGGPSMNSRLNVVLREHSGLVYTVESSMAAYSDTGLWCAYLGCDAKDIKRCLRLVRKELDKFRAKPLSDRRLLAAKRQLKGQVTIACDNHENFALDFGRVFLHTGAGRDIASLSSLIDAVTAEDMLRVATEVFNPATMTTLIYTGNK